MKLLHDHVQDGGVFDLDDTYLVNCKFSNCVLLSSGVEYQAMDSSFINCRLLFSGAAANTFRLLQAFGWGPKESSVLRPV